MTALFLQALFPAVLNMSLTASVIIVFVLLARLLLRKAPRIFSYALWAVVLFRLLCPVSLSAGYSLLSLLDAPAQEISPAASRVEYLSSDVLRPLQTQELPETASASGEVPSDDGAALTQTQQPQADGKTPAAPTAPQRQSLLPLVSGIYLAGLALLLLYSTLSLLLLRRRLVGAVCLGKNIYLADHISSPFVLGLLRPRICLPSSLSPRERSYILLHEQVHIRRLDPAIRLLSFAALCLHWFNPLVWLSFYLSGKDMEMSCDEAVLKRLGTEIRADYSSSLLQLSTGRTRFAGTPLAFGEGDTKSRVRNLLRWRKPQTWLVLLAALACLAVIAACAVNPRGQQQQSGQYASMEDFAQRTMDGKKTVPYYRTDGGEATANVTGTKLAWLEKQGEVPGLAPEGTLEAWKFSYLVQVDVQPGAILLPGGTYEEDGWYDLEGQGGHNVVALRYPDGSYDILYDAPVNDGVDFYGYHNSWEEAVYDWYVAEKRLSLPLYVKDLQPEGVTGNCPARRYDGNGWYVYIPLSAWSKAAGQDRWDSQYGSGAYFSVQPRAEAMEQVRLYYGTLGAWPLSSGMESPFDSYYLLDPQGSDAHTELFFIPDTEQSSYLITCAWKEDTRREDEAPVLHAMAASFTLDSRISAQEPTLSSLQAALSGLSMEEQPLSIRYEEAGISCEQAFNGELLALLQDSANKLLPADSPAPAEGALADAGSLRLLLNEDGTRSILLTHGSTAYGVCLLYTDGSVSDCATVEDPFLKLYLEACAEKNAVELHDLDKDDKPEAIVWRSGKNRRSVAVYDYYENGIHCLDVNRETGGVSSDYTGLMGNIQPAYGNDLSVILPDGSSVLYRYADGSFSYLCTLAEALS